MTDAAEISERLAACTLHPFAVPMRIAFRRTTVRRGVLIHGPAGWGEFSPFPEYPPSYARRWLVAALASACDPAPPMLRDRIPVNVTVPAVAPDVARALVEASPAGTAKVKVAEPGQTLADDVARVAAVRAALGFTGALRVDANGAWSVDEAEAAITALDAHHLEYVEQPVATLEEMAELRRRVAVPLAADESVRTAADPARIVGLEAADLLVLKVQPLGGLAAALAIARSCGLPVVVSSALETSVGLGAGLAFAAALPDLDHACGLATADLLADDVVADPLTVGEDGCIGVRRPEPDPDRLARLRPDDADELIARVHAAAAAPETHVVAG